MNQIKNLNKLERLFSSEFLYELELDAQMYQRYNRISFKIMQLNEEEIVLRVKQEKAPNGNYFDSQRLEEIGHEFLEPIKAQKANLNIQVQTIPFVNAPIEQVDPKWIQKKMNDDSIPLKKIVEDTGIDKTTLSAYINGKKTLTQNVKAFFYYYFKAIEQHSQKEEIAMT